MDFDELEGNRKTLKKKIDYILEPMVIDILLKKPEDPLKFMIAWL